MYKLLISPFSFSFCPPCLASSNPTDSSPHLDKSSSSVCETCSPAFLLLRNELRRATDDGLTARMQIEEIQSQLDGTNSELKLLKKEIEQLKKLLDNHSISYEVCLFVCLFYLLSYSDSFLHLFSFSFSFSF
jgi:hypothetical protein